MKYNVFDVVKTKDNKMGTIIEACENKVYRVDMSNNTDDKSKVVKLNEKDISEVVYKN